MSGQIILSGITWNHSRALPPLVATAQRFEEMHPGVKVDWKTRSLHEFGPAHVSPLAREYDLLVVDHPMMGEAFESGALVDLRERLDAHVLQGLAADSVGRSYASYALEDRLFALPIDAAAPAASYRPDLLARAGAAPPRTWADLLTLAARGLAIMPGFPPDLFLNYVGLCGSEPEAESDRMIDRQTGSRRLEDLRELAKRMPDATYGWNPIAVYEQMAGADEYAYCPFAYSYSNYSRAGFARHLIAFASPVRLDDSIPMRTVLGGTGLAVSSNCRNQGIALEYAQYVASGECQRTLYAQSGGQPSHRSAWVDEGLNRLTNDFFRNTFEAVESAYVRPRHEGYTEFQAVAGNVIVEYLQVGGEPGRAVDEINAGYRKSKMKVRQRLQHA